MSRNLTPAATPLDAVPSPIHHHGRREATCYHPWVPRGDESRLELELVRRAVNGDQDAARQLVTRLAPIVQKSISRLWPRGIDAARRPLELRDLVQDAFVALFANGGRELLRWDPARGMQLESFVSMITRRFVISKLRSRQPEPVELDPCVAPEPAALESNVDDVFAARENLHLLGERLRAALSPLGLEMFHRLFVLEQDVAAICRESQMTADAVYQWRKRLRDTLQQLREQNQLPMGGGVIGNPGRASS